MRSPDLILPRIDNETPFRLGFNIQRARDKAAPNKELPLMGLGRELKRDKNVLSGCKELEALRYLKICIKMSLFLLFNLKIAQNQFKKAIYKLYKKSASISSN